MKLFYKPLLLSFLTLLLGLQYASAQTPVDTVPDDGTPFEFSDPKELLYKFDSCLAPVVNRISVVRFDGYANAFVDLPNAKKQQQFTIISADGKTYNKKFAADTGFFAVNLPLHMEFTVSSTNSCGKEVKVGTFSTETDVKEQLSVSPKLFNKVSDYYYKPGQENVYQLIVGAQDISYYEKLSFVQEYLWDGQPFPANIDFVRGGKVIYYVTDAAFFIDIKKLLEYWDKIYKSKCNCKVINVDATVSPNAGYVQPNGTVYPGYQSYIEYNNSNSYKAWAGYSRLGAARYEQAWQEGKNSGGKQLIFGGDPSYAVTPYYGRIWYNWICTNASGYPSSVCACPPKDIHITYRYDTELRSNLSNMPWGLQSKGANAHVEDWAILTSVDGAGNLTVLGANKASVDQSYNTSINGAFVKGVLDIVVAIVSAYVTQGASIATSIPSIVNGINTLITTPLNNTQGDQGDLAQWYTLLDGQKKLQLTVNNPMRINLYSSGAIRLSGFTKWHNTGRIVSGYNLAAFVYCGKPDNAPSYCSSNGGAAWVMGTLVPANLGGLKADVNTFYNQLGYYEYPYTEAGAKKVNCGQRLSGLSMERTPSAPSHITTTAEKLSAGPYTYEIYSLDGRKIGNGVSAGKALELPVINRGFTAPDGIYILQLKDITGQKSIIKFFHSR
ncbi:hypothetical protein KTO58_19655 [Chitinophaga pendula]|uniref:hypothetical protein n=1 Tax=Chitinophaga TaxID=79328 RepID=UPI000BAED4C7|nr:MULTISPECIES: hypothetical protein [Chitinophaga]ASZ11115.1 hypothetical protein CK934_09145 [Chitinophaga sp. MD30]UCJ05888.1 hypothetical protein KTO58_19655 [Chitinophaga pendula]